MLIWYIRTTSGNNQSSQKNQKDGSSQPDLYVVGYKFLDDTTNFIPLFEHDEEGKRTVFE